MLPPPHPHAVFAIDDSDVLGIDRDRADDEPRQHRKSFSFPASPLPCCIASFFFAMTVVGTGCATTKETRLQKDARIVDQENDPKRLLARGKAFHSVGDYTRAEQYYAAALQQGASEKEVLPLLLRACIQSTRYQVAIDYALPVLQKHPDDWRLRMIVASLYTAVGQPGRARDQYERVVQQEPNEPTARYGLAVLLRDEFHDRAAADKHFREYLRVAPEGAHAEEARGSLLKDVSDAPVAAPATPVVAPTPIPSNAPPKKLP